MTKPSNVDYGKVSEKEKEGGGTLAHLKDKHTPLKRTGQPLGAGIINFEIPFVAASLTKRPLFRGRSRSGLENTLTTRSTLAKGRVGTKRYETL